MAVIRPFKALRPRADLVEKVASLPYDVMSSDEAREAVRGNPFSFLHVAKAEIDLEADIDLYDERVYLKARENLDNMIAKEILREDKQPCLYIYRQTMGQRSQTGIVACASIDDYLDNTIKKHELTRADKERDRSNHVKYCDANTGPIFLTYRCREEINQVVKRWMEREAVYDFSADDGVSHTVWVIDEEKVLQELLRLFAGVDVLYIADGHHRAASAVRVGQWKREQNPGYTGEEEYNYFLAVIFPDRDLYIMDYNRVVRDLNGFTVNEFLNRIAEKFDLRLYEGEGPYRPSERHSFGMYLEGRWYVLTAHPGTFNPDDPVERLDVSILQNNLLGPVLGITDPRTEQRIDFVGGIRGLKELENRVKQDMKVAFSMYPTTIQDLMDIADAGKMMPPKSTWFEPKLRSGIFVHRLG